MTHKVTLLNSTPRALPIRVLLILDYEKQGFTTGFEDTWEDFEEYYLQQYWVTTEMLEYLKEHFDSIKEEAMRIKIKDML